MVGVMKSVLRMGNRLSYRVLPEGVYLRLKYRAFFKMSLDLRNPRRFSEKIYWLKIVNGKLRKALVRRCYDKYHVRSYVAERLGDIRAASLLNEVYGVYENAEQIDFDALPDSFALKCTQGSGTNVLCPNKALLSKADAVAKLNAWVAEANLASQGKGSANEEHYAFDGHARIICERYLSDEGGRVPADIRIYCFNGHARLYVIDFGTTNDDGSHGSNIVRNVYDEQWNLLDVDLGRPHDPAIGMARPENLDEMRETAEILAADFPFVRVDLYDLGGGSHSIRGVDFYSHGRWVRGASGRFRLGNGQVA